MVKNKKSNRAAKPKAKKKASGGRPAERERKPDAAAEAKNAGGQGYRCEIPSDPCAIVIFGASGDLSRRMLLPALFELASAGCLAPRFAILGFAHTKKSREEFRKMAEEALGDAGDAKSRRAFLETLDYLVNEDDGEEDYLRLAERLEELDRKHDLGGDRMFYLSVPPKAYPGIVEGLERSGLARPAKKNSWVRIIVEKPFGRDLESARELNQKLLSVFDEDQVFRIDHYLGKETVQNLLVFRFANGIFEPVWNRNYIDHVQITAAETVGVERRAGFYESTGAVRDMLQNHLLQLVSLVALEPPATFTADAVRNEKIKILESIRPFRGEDLEKAVVLGQYAAGKMDGKKVPGYRDEPDVDPRSRTETYVATRMWIDNWRWAGVPFYVRTGKRLARRATRIAIAFRRAPHRVFRGRDVQPNWLVLDIQPDEGISLSFGAKRPGPEMDLGTVRMDFRYRDSFGSGGPSAYATLLNDAIRGEATLFDRADSVEAAWAIVDPIVEAWSRSRRDPAFYPAGSHGPAEAEELLKQDGRHWKEP